MLVSKSNEINTSTFINSGSCNERKSSKIHGVTSL